LLAVSLFRTRQSEQQFRKIYANC